MSTGNENMFLYWGSGSGPCWKPMIVLAEKGLWKGMPNKLVEFSKKEHKGEDVMKLNPRGQVPTFKDGDLVVNESGAICMYLEEKFSNNKLMPADPVKRADVYQRMFESDNIRAIITVPLVYYRWTTKKEDQDEELLKKKTEEAKAELDKWNAMLAGKDYLCGSDFTMADVFFYPMLAFLVRSGAKMPGQPDLMKYYERVSERPSVKETWPPHWNEGKGPDMLCDL